MPTELSMIHFAVGFLFVALFCKALKVVIDSTRNLPAENKRLANEIEALKSEVEALKIKVEAMTPYVTMEAASLLPVSPADDQIEVDPTVINDAPTAPDVTEINSDDDRSFVESYLASHIKAALSGQSSGRIVAPDSSIAEKN